MKKFGNILWGIVLIALGLIFAINALNIASINIFFDGWWTLFILVPCFIGLFHEQNRTGNIIGLTIGTLLLLSAQGILDFSIIMKLIVPIILVMVGISIIFKDTLNKKINRKVKQLNKKGLENEYYATFSEQVIDLPSEEFNGANLNAVFGSVKFNMKNAIINGEQIINTSSIFGGTEIIVPPNVNVKIKSSSLFGGVANKIANSRDENVPTIYINATCLFGGAEIR